jgi:hypothetical protein
MAQFRNHLPSDWHVSCVLSNVFCSSGPWTYRQGARHKTRFKRRYGPKGHKIGFPLDLQLHSKHRKNTARPLHGVIQAHTYRCLVVTGRFLDTKISKKKFICTCTLRAFLKKLQPLQNTIFCLHILQNRRSEGVVTWILWFYISEEKSKNREVYANTPDTGEEQCHRIQQFASEMTCPESWSACESVSVTFLEAISLFSSPIGAARPTCYLMACAFVRANARTWQATAFWRS